MTLRLILTRHAKAGIAMSGSDRMRPLTERGHDSAAAIGAWLAGKGHMPDLVLASDATRARETWAGMAPHLAAPDRVIWTPDLYLATGSEILHVLRGAAQARCVLLLGHNPGIAQFAAAIVEQSPSHARFDDFPTGATLVAQIGADRWNNVTPGSARALDFVVPRDLTG